MNVSTVRTLREVHASAGDAEGEPPSEPEGGGARSSAARLDVPPQLVQAIREGNCIAFVGAGFSAAAQLPGWSGLLTAILETGAQEKSISPGLQSEIEAMIGEGTSSSLDRAAQILEDNMGGQRMAHVVSEHLSVTEVNASMARRLELLRTIPFDAILTTNFDSLLPGIPAAHPDAKEVMADILRRPPLSMTEQIMREFHWEATQFKRSGADAPPGYDQEFVEMMRSFPDSQGFAAFHEKLIPSDDAFEGSVPVIQLHGTVADSAYLRDPGLAFTREGYRNLLYNNSSYQKFLHSVMSSKTVLYIGFSFSDEYINEMRSGIMNMLRSSAEPPTIAYAITMKRPESDIQFFAKHEGMRLLNYIPEDKESPGFEGLDRWLEAIHAETNPLYIFAKYLEGRRVVCASSNCVLCWLLRAFRLIAKIRLKVDLGRVVFEPYTSDMGAAEFLESLGEKHEEGVDLLLLQYGHQDDEGRPAKAILDAMAAKPQLRCPVLVTDTCCTKARKREVMALGAAAYADTLMALLGEVQRVLSAPTQEEFCCIQ